MSIYIVRYWQSVSNALSALNTTWWKRCIFSRRSKLERCQRKIERISAQMWDWVRVFPVGDVVNIRKSKVMVTYGIADDLLRQICVRVLWSFDYCDYFYYQFHKVLF